MASNKIQDPGRTQNIKVPDVLIAESELEGYDEESRTTLRDEMSRIQEHEITEISKVVEGLNGIGQVFALARTCKAEDILEQDSIGLPRAHLAKHPHEFPDDP